MATVKMKEGWLVLSMVNGVFGDQWDFKESEPDYADHEVYDAEKQQIVHVDVVLKRIMYIEADDVEVQV